MIFCMQTYFIFEFFEETTLNWEDFFLSAKDSFTCTCLEWFSSLYGKRLKEVLFECWWLVKGRTFDGYFFRLEYF